MVVVKMLRVMVMFFESGMIPMVTITMVVVKMLRVMVMVMISMVAKMWE